MTTTMIRIITLCLIYSALTASQIIVVLVVNAFPSPTTTTASSVRGVRNANIATSAASTTNIATAAQSFAFSSPIVTLQRQRQNQHQQRQRRRTYSRASWKHQYSHQQQHRHALTWRQESHHLSNKSYYAINTRCFASTNDNDNTNENDDNYNNSSSTSGNDNRNTNKFDGDDDDDDDGNVLDENDITNTLNSQQQQQQQQDHSNTNNDGSKADYSNINNSSTPIMQDNVKDNDDASSSSAPNSITNNNNSSNNGNDNNNNKYSKDNKDAVMGMESGWANFARTWAGRYLLPSSSSTSSSPSSPSSTLPQPPSTSSSLEELNNIDTTMSTNVDVSTYNPKSRGVDSSVDPIFFRASPLNLNKKSKSTNNNGGSKEEEEEDDENDETAIDVSSSASSANNNGISSMISAASPPITNAMNVTDAQLVNATADDGDGSSISDDGGSINTIATMTSTSTTALGKKRRLALRILRGTAKALFKGGKKLFLLSTSKKQHNRNAAVEMGDSDTVAGGGVVSGSTTQLALPESGVGDTILSEMGNTTIESDIATGRNDDGVDSVFNNITDMTMNETIKDEAMESSSSSLLLSIEQPTTSTTESMQPNNTNNEKQHSTTQPSSSRQRRSSFPLSKSNKQSRLPRWPRRKQRALALLKAAKNAMLLFVVTFLAGNIMNQFVDLDEDGSFEVRFGKVLSSSSSSVSLPSSSSQSSSLSPPLPAAELPSSSPLTPSLPSTPSPKPLTPKRNAPQKRGVGFFRASTSSNQGYAGDSARAQALGLVSRAVHKQGPAVVRVETETDLNANGDGSNNSPSRKSKTEKLEKENNDIPTGKGNEFEDRGDIFDGVPEIPPPADDFSGKNTDFGQGSGIIINSEGYILTNAHVVDGATRVYVLLTDGRRFPAIVKGSDDIVDVAVLQIASEEMNESGGEELMANLPVAELGDSDYLEVGRFVVAVGSPGGLDNTCTIGIVSGLKRCPKVVGIPDKMGVLDYIQTDAAINQGNSGGPLVDVESGKIVGINTCIRANMEGTSFAIPINKVMGVVQDLSEGKQITHGYLGVHMSTMNPSLARYFNKLQQQRKIPEKEGVMIEKVFKNSPAQEGGLKKFDFVTEIGGRRVERADDAHVMIDRAPIGEQLSIKVMRDDTELTIQVNPEDLSPRLKQLREERMKRKKAKANA